MKQKLLSMALRSPTKKGTDPRHSTHAMAEYARDAERLTAEIPSY